MATRKTNAKPRTEQKTEPKSEQKAESVTLERGLKEEGEGRTPETVKNEGKKTGNSTKTEQVIQVSEKPEGVTLEQALEEQGEGRTPEPIKNEGKKQAGTSKAEQAMKIMVEMWDDIQSGKVRRKDVIQRFIDEVSLTKAGATTYYGNCKQKITKNA